MKAIALLVAVLLTGAATAGQKPARAQTPKPDTKSGAATFAKYCASCHGKQGQGDGPAAETLKNPPANLTTLQQRFEGRFPRGYVEAVLIFGKRLASHGSEDMPVWGARFRKMDPMHDRSGQKHIDDLVAYIESIQAK